MALFSKTPTVEEEAEDESRVSIDVKKGKKAKGKKTKVNGAKEDNDEKKTDRRTNPDRKRPTSSGTAIVLSTATRSASEQYQAAQKAEAAYKAKKRADDARLHKENIPSHFKQSAHHLKEGIKCCWKLFFSIPALISDWRQGRQKKAEKRAAQRDLAKKKKLEERLAKQQAGTNDDDDEEVV